MTLEELNITLLEEMAQNLQDYSWAAEDVVDALAQDERYTEYVANYGFISDKEVAVAIDDHRYDLDWLQKFIKEANPTETWHFVDDDGWLDDRDFHGKVARLVDELANVIEQTEEALKEIDD